MACSTGSPEAYVNNINDGSNKLALGEFDLISRYFAPLASRGKPAFGLSDDGAVLSPPTGRDLVFTKDALVAGVHFFPDDPAASIAHKALRVNLSDLAAMGAQPLGYLLALALPTDMKNIEEWIGNFCTGLQQDQDEFGCSLLGGDTVSTSGPLMISVTAIGTVAPGRALRRVGARPGDDIYVSGNLGDAALGLKCLEGEISLDNETDSFLETRYYLPEPRLALGQRLGTVASAVMDISDGLAGDIRHICALSGLGAEIKADLIPLSAAAGKILAGFPACKNLIWTGGDDYELLFTAHGTARGDITKLAAELGISLTAIGRMTEKKTITITDKNGWDLLGDDQGFRHF